jgi:hypothetical protein
MCESISEWLILNLPYIFKNKMITTTRKHDMILLRAKSLQEGLKSVKKAHIIGGQ